ncbi:MAG: hypothetical protein HY611_03550 [Elusimicrobia bacterium]|nr:hypothetical protein [Elusimicrobiota bacterium]
MTENTRRHLKVEQFLGEWAVVAYSHGSSPNDGTVWLRGFDTQKQATEMARRLEDAMRQKEVA